MRYNVCMSSESTPRSERFNTFGHKFKANPYPTYAAMRSQAPLCRRVAKDGKTAIWFVTRYEDAAAILCDRRFVKDVRNTLTAAEVAQLPPEPPNMQLLSNHMLNMDPPDHTRLRALVSKAFTAQMVEGMQGRIQTIADTLLDRVQQRGQMDLIDEYAFPLPITVIAELLGIPPEDSSRFRQWSRAFVTPSPNIERSQKKYQRTRRWVEDFQSYLQQILAQRRIDPQDDLITSLLQTEEAGDSLSEAELFSMVILLIVTGHETVVNFIGNGVLALTQFPEQMQKLRKNPQLLPAAIEEMLRYDGPAERAMMRFATEDIAFGGQLIRRGDMVSVVLGAANRDPEQFAAPDRFDLERGQNRHLAMGMGIHYCLGASLARLEGSIAIGTLLRRLPNLRLAVPLEALRWRTIPVLRGMEHMPVAWDL